jgi:hypothetical protein
MNKLALVQKKSPGLLSAAYDPQGTPAAYLLGESYSRIFLEAQQRCDLARGTLLLMPFRMFCLAARWCASTLLTITARGDLSGPAELGAVNPDAVHDHG